MVSRQIGDVRTKLPPFYDAKSGLGVTFVACGALRNSLRIKDLKTSCPVVLVPTEANGLWAYFPKGGVNFDLYDSSGNEVQITVSPTAQG
jgi:hypothetical protein